MITRMAKLYGRDIRVAAFLLDHYVPFYCVPCSGGKFDTEFTVNANDEAHLVAAFQAAADYSDEDIMDVLIAGMTDKEQEDEA